MTVNVELLEQTMQYINDHPEQHNQATWLTDCGTASCFAGWACHLSGWNLFYKVESVGTVNVAGEFTPVALSTAMARKDERTCNVADAASSELGITWDDRVVLFAAGNSRDVLNLMVKDLVNGENIRQRHEYQQELGES